MNNLYKKLLLICLGVALNTSINAMENNNQHQDYCVLMSNDSMMICTINTESGYIQPLDITPLYQLKSNMRVMFQNIILNYDSLKKESQLDPNIIMDLIMKSTKKLAHLQAKEIQKIKEYYLQKCWENKIFSESDSKKDLECKKLICHIINNFHALFEMAYCKINTCKLNSKIICKLTYKILSFAIKDLHEQLI